MGKWTGRHYDDVLASKIKGLVAGAIKRTKLEKTEPTITYQTFVEELDGGDSFTTSLIDILVKELAERRTRPTSADRRLIADSSAKSLRMLATPLRVYRDRSTGRGVRRSANLTDYLTAPPEEMDMDEDDDEFESMLGNAASTTEGARVSSEMYDSSQRWSRPSGPTLIRRFHPSYSAAVAPSSSDDPHDFLSRPHSPPIPNQSGPWTLPPTSATLSGSSLFRQASIRRPVRSRTVDFNDFTSHRRSTMRQDTAQEPLTSRSDAVDNRAAPSLLSPRDRSLSPTQDETSTSVRATQSARRFFPFSRNRRHESAGGSAWATDTSSVETPDELSSYTVDTSDQHVQPVLHG